ncbi:hypothetical protein [Paraburkholderia sp. J8-2]|uniref:hypothetical protein n=1 Tax=Paraburkholderia sp. J8-2 TaxID=2805440 RepID=UPI002AB79124|nr:hypothetical protein [Paraburkholderia sp. J8-2]
MSGASKAAKPPKARKAVHVHEGVKIVEWENARKGQQFEVIDPHGYHYRYAYTLEDAQDVVRRVMKWGW